MAALLRGLYGSFAGEGNAQNAQELITKQITPHHRLHGSSDRSMTN
ncbi:hypothetical protein JL2886_02050 [Phaeobacter gallaeciensis]|uniref:Uncharacterized protein n=1 Tax=Phaeobacter gallaeciensis TaxID=60890 RepID=A0A1B0ZS49_9RHOB|nr:hypothetical protein JL2886_02050 [Phaeobacter gallaeciensis]